MKKFLTLAIVIIIAGFVGWYIYGSQPATSSQTGTATTSSGNGLTLTQLQNASYDVGSFFYFNDRPSVILMNGDYSDTVTQNGSTIHRNVSIDTVNSAPLVALGDLNADEVGDAAVMLNVSYNNTSPAQQSGPETERILEVFVDGGSGLSQTGQPTLVATTTDFSLPASTTQSLAIGPSIQTITGMSITNGIISISGTVYTNENATSTASTPATLQYKLVSGVLVKIGQQFSVPSQGSSALGGTSWTTYTDKDNNAQFDYPIGVDLSNNPADIKAIKSYLPINPVALIVLTLPLSLYPAATTVNGAAIVYTATKAASLQDCINQAESQSGSPATPIDISIPSPTASASSAPLDFYQIPSDYGGCWAGGCAFGTLYATYQNATCYQFGLQTAVTDPGNYGGTAASIKNVEAINTSFENQLTALFDRIISTIQFQ